MPDGMGGKHAGASEGSFLFTPGASPAIGFTSGVSPDEHSLPNFPFLDGNSGMADHSQELRGNSWEIHETPGKEIVSGSPHLMPGNFSSSSPSEVSSASTAQGRPGQGAEAAGSSLTEAELRRHFGQPLHEAALKLGLHLDVLKQLCRKYGIIKWPYSRLAAIEERLATLRAHIDGPEGSSDVQMHIDKAQLELQRDRIYAGNLDEVECSPIDFPSPGDHRPEEGVEWKLSCSDPAADASRSRGTSQHGGKGCSLNEDNSFFPGEDYFESADAFGDGGSGEAFQEGAGAGAGTGTGSHAVCGAEGVSLEKLYEENGSLKAISQYLMQERQDLMKKLETLSSQSNNMKILAKVLKHHIREAGGGGSLPGLDDGVGMMNEHGGGIDDVNFAPSSVGDMLIETGGGMLPGLSQQEDIAGGDDGNTDLNWFRTDSSEHVAPSVAAEGALANFCAATPEEGP